MFDVTFGLKRLSAESQRRIVPVCPRLFETAHFPVSLLLKMSLITDATLKAVFVAPALTELWKRHDREPALVGATAEVRTTRLNIRRKSMEEALACMTLARIVVWHYITLRETIRAPLEPKGSGVSFMTDSSRELAPLQRTNFELEMSRTR